MFLLLVLKSEYGGVSWVVIIKLEPSIGNIGWSVEFRDMTFWKLILLAKPSVKPSPKLPPNPK
jgi:hypothetical protein